MEKNYGDARVIIICLSALFLWIGCGGSKAGSETTTTPENTEVLQAEESEDPAANTSTYRAYTPSQMAETDWGDEEDDQKNEVADLPKKKTKDKPTDVLDDFSSCGDDPMCGGMLSMDDKKNEDKKRRKNKNKR